MSQVSQSPGAIGGIVRQAVEKPFKSFKNGPKHAPSPPMADPLPATMQ